MPEAAILVPPEEIEAEDEWYNVPFSHEEVAQAVIRAPNKKAPGPDRLCYEHIKMALPALLPLFTWILT